MLKIDSLTTSILRYKKSLVCEYVAQLNEEFSRNILEKDQNYSQQIKALEEKIEQPESDLNTTVLRGDDLREQLLSENYEDKQEDENSND